MRLVIRRRPPRWRAWKVTSSPRASRPWPVLVVAVSRLPGREPACTSTSSSRSKTVAGPASMSDTTVTVATRGRLLEAGDVAGAGSDDLRLAVGQVDHRGGLHAALAGVEDRVHRVVEQFLDVPAGGHRLVVAGQQQRAGDQRLAQFRQQRAHDDVLRNAYAHGLFPGVEQAARNLPGGREDERVRAGRRRLHQAEGGVVDLYELA